MIEGLDIEVFSRIAVEERFPHRVSREHLQEILKGRFISSYKRDGPLKT
jgi:hypothetical protein